MGLDYLFAGALGLIEGITEFLPISSTAHLQLVVHFFQSHYPNHLDPIAFKEAVGSYCIVLQGVAIAAMIPIFWPEIRLILQGIFLKNQAGRLLLLNLILAFFPAAFLGLCIGQARLNTLEPFIPVGLLLGSLLLWWSLKRSTPLTDSTYQNLSPKKALLIGALQSLALWPGVSRSLMGIVGGLWVGMDQKHAVRFSFLLGLFTLSAASMYSALKNYETLMTAFDSGPFLVGILITFLAALFVSKKCLEWLSGSFLIVCLYYRVILAVVLSFYYL